MIKTDFLVIGSGVAGLTYALKASKHGKVTIITKKNIHSTNTALAQGGIAAVFKKSDSFDLHIKDTLNAGDGLCDKKVVEMIVKQAPKRIKELVKYGADFNKKGKGKYDFEFGQEGGHSAKRIIFSHDLTGKEIEDTLIEKVKKNKNIKILEDHIAINLITFSQTIKNGVVALQSKNICCGVYVLDNKNDIVKTITAKIIMLASGGAGKVYLYTSNPDIATGDGIAMAYRAGALIANLEFVQFHPTCLYHPKAKNFLISEAIRGEGAVLLDSKGRRFMDKYSSQKELACRDVVARAIDSELKKTGANSVFLNISHKKASFIKKRFPNIYEKCLKLGIDITKESIPVVPAAHYMCGGVAVDLNGKTNLKRLYAIGETAYTGFHGANRLASNSLLEALVYSQRAYKVSIKEFEAIKDKNHFILDEWDDSSTTDTDDAIVVAHNWDEIRRLMWNYVGIVRTDKRLYRALRRIKNIQEEINEYYWNFKVTSDLIELRNLAVVAEIIIKSALMRKESRGLHFNLGYLKKDNQNWLRPTMIGRRGNFKGSNL